jgi:hypothetical protein
MNVCSVEANRNKSHDFFFTPAVEILGLFDATLSSQIIFNLATIARQRRVGGIVLPPVTALVDPQNFKFVGLASVEHMLPRRACM